MYEQSYGKQQERLRHPKMSHSWKPIPTLGMKGKRKYIVSQKPVRAGTMKEKSNGSCGHGETQPQPEPRHGAG